MKSLVLLISASLLALTACGSSTIGGGGGEAGSGGNGTTTTTSSTTNTTGLCNGVPSSESCTDDASCPSGYVCVADTDPNSCHSSSCSCTDEGWQCTADCQLGGSSCVLAGTQVNTCKGVPNPASCDEDSDCPTGFACIPDPDPNACHSSTCSCDPVNGWQCTADCMMGGRTCLALEEPPPGLCNGTPSPVGCDADSDCPNGFTCIADPDPNACHPSSCTCDPASGWTCTEDCMMGGNICAQGL